ncbi:type II secretion system protein GspM [Hyphomicrobium sp. ghe19]|uniref:type II secretion system protein GspM n=1 Tax=Hyphomicrobium sp. ghe19 TaxID=2682968 RepID=UPI001367828C|nr:hypothetical protein HYPP_03221 [Hyphomicrobium sp. ghe19]
MTTLAGTPLSRALALCILVALAAVLWFAIAQPVLRSFTEIELAKMELSNRYERYRWTASQREAVEAQGRAQHQAVLAGGFYFEEQSLEIAAAKLQNSATEIVRNNQGQVQVAQRLASQAEDRPPSVAIAVSFSVSNKGLTQLLSQIRNAKPAILIDSLAIRSNLQPSAQRNAGDAPAQGPFEDDLILNVDMQVKAFVSLGGRP